MAINILVVDDSSVIRKMIIKTVKLSGIELNEIHEAGNGQDGLDVLEDNWVDLVFIDLNMPVMNGEDMIDRIKSNSTWEDIPIVVISTEGSETRINQLKQKQVEFIHKPFTPEQIRTVITNMMGSYHEPQNV